MERLVAQRLTALSRRWRRLGDQTLAQLGVSNATGWCLVYLSRLGENARQSDLAHIMGVREATLVRTLAQLESARLIIRSPNPNDARANIMRITEHGQSLVAEIERLLAQLRHEILQDISEEELETTMRVCDRIDDRFNDRRV